MNDGNVMESNSFTVFADDMFGNLHVALIDGEPWFIGKEVAENLGYAKARNAISSHVEKEDKKVAPFQGDLGGTQKMTIINESGLYSLILRSKLPEAKKFKRWVTSEVLPSIRKTKIYCKDGTVDKMLVDFMTQQSQFNANQLEFNKMFFEYMKNTTQNQQQVNNQIEDSERDIEYRKDTVNRLIKRACAINGESWNAVLRSVYEQMKKEGCDLDEAVSTYEDRHGSGGTTTFIAIISDKSLCDKMVDLLK